MRSRIKCSVAVLVVAGVACAPAAGQAWYWPPSEFSATPSCVFEPTVSFVIGGQWPDSCVPRGAITTSVAPGRIDIAIEHGYPADTFCLAVISDWSRSVGVSQIPSGTYGVYASFTSVSRPPLGPSQVGSVVISCGTTCVADLDDGTGGGTPDGAVTIADLVFFLVQFEGGDARADISNAEGQPGHDGAVTIEDLVLFLTRFEAGC